MLIRDEYLDEAGPTRWILVLDPDTVPLRFPPELRRMLDRPTLPRKPSRAETARTNGARSRGPATDAGKARSSRNALAHGLRARSLTPVATLGESWAVLDAHLAAYRREFPAPGPYARDLAEAVACANLRAARAEHLEAQFLTELIANGESLAGPDSRAALALILRYRREAELSAKRTRQELEALAKARAAGLLPDQDEAAAAGAELDAALAELPCPNEPKLEKAEPAQPLTTTLAPSNDDAGTGGPEPPPRPERALRLLLGSLRTYARCHREALASFSRGLSPDERLRARAALAVLEGKAREQGEEPQPWLRLAADVIDDVWPV